MSVERFTSASRRVLLVLAGLAVSAVTGNCNSIPELVGVSIAFGTATIRAIQAGDSSTYNYSRVFVNNTTFTGTMTEVVSAYSSTMFGQGLTVTRTFNYVTVAADGTQGASATHTQAMSLIPVGGATAVSSFVEQDNDGTVLQVVTPTGGDNLPFYTGTLESGQSFSYPFTLSDGTMATETSSVLGAETVTVPYGTVATLMVSSLESMQGPSGQTSSSRSAWRHPVLGVIKRVTDIVDTPSGGTSNTSTETIELVSTNITTGS